MALTSKLTAIANAIRSKTGKTGKLSLDAMVTEIDSISGGGLPSGFSAIAKGTYTLSSDSPGGSTFTVTHNLGKTPDMFLFFSPANVATTYSMLGAFRSSYFGWRSSSYLNKCFYHGNSTTTVSGTDVTTSYGIKTLTSTQATVTTYNTSTTVYWRKGTYHWIAISF